MVFAGAKFCSHCGAAIARTEVDSGKKLSCPRCRVDMQDVLIGKTNLQECSKCEGIWVDKDSLQKICDDREEQSAVLGMATPLPDGDNFEMNVRYVPCPVCSTLMNRVNFARCSHVVVDVCRAHGTWFDKDELRRIVEFIRGGGMDMARKEEIDELDEKRRALRAAQMAAASSDSLPWSGNNRRNDHRDGISAVANMIMDLFD